MKTLSIFLIGILLFCQTSQAQKRGTFPVQLDKVFYLDSLPPFISDSSALWTFGLSQKNWLKPDSTHQKVWITDTLQLLEGKKTAYLDIPFPENLGNDNYHFSLTHKYDFDSLSGGSFWVSTDGGIEFYPIHTDTGYYSPYWWHQGLYAKNNLLFNGEAGYTGRSNSWVQTEINFTYFILLKKPQASAPILRLVYQSADSAKSHEGWMIADIKLGREHRAGGFGELFKENQLGIYPNPGKQHFTLQLPEKGALKLYNLQGALVWENECLAGEQKIQIPDLAPGIYTLIFTSAHYQIPNKIEIQ